VHSNQKRRCMAHLVVITLKGNHDQRGDLGYHDQMRDLHHATGSASGNTTMVEAKAVETRKGVG
jgi:hypothetical protein